MKPNIIAQAAAEIFQDKQARIDWICGQSEEMRDRGMAYIRGTRFSDDSVLVEGWRVAPEPVPIARPV